MWLKIYFWILLVLNILGLFVMLEFTPLAIIDFIGIILSLVLLLAVGSYIYKKKILSKKHWKIIFWVIIVLFLEEIIELYLLPKNFVTELFPFLKSSIPLSSVERLFSWFVYIPAIYTVYKLAEKGK